MSHSQPKVSIGMPVYNGEKYIRNALDALLAQTFTNFELVISDNASTDKTEKICNEYAFRDERIRYVRQAENRGAAANFQLVVDEAVGEYFMWAAYDDFWEPEFIAQALTLLTDTSIGFAFPTFKLKSIHYGIQKKISGDTFKGIEDKSRARRILSFANIHNRSHKCNLVYSIFRTNILREAIAIQDISSDDLFGLVMLGITRGTVMDKCYFSKRYSQLWPGFRKKIFVRPEKIALFEKARDDMFNRAKSLFPELSITLELIRSNYKPYKHSHGFKIIRNLFP